MPYISIIVPIYNAERTLQRCIEIVLTQTYSEFELILINDGSTDKSYDICKEYMHRDTRVSVYSHENRGVSWARNEGMEKSIGKYILFIDSDDYLPANYCMSLVDAKHEFGGDSLYITGIKKKTIDHETVICYGQEDISCLKRKDAIKIYNKGLLNSPCNKLYNLSIIKKYKIRMKQGISIAEDLLFNLHYLDALGDKDIYILNSVFYIYMERDTSLVHSYHEDYYRIHKGISKLFLELSEEWSVPEDDYDAYYKHYWSILHDCFQNTLALPRKSFLSKFHKNTKIMKDVEFQRILELNKSDISKLRYLIYKKGSYGMLYILLYIKEKLKKLACRMSQI